MSVGRRGRYPKRPADALPSPPPVRRRIPSCGEGGARHPVSFSLRVGPSPPPGGGEVPLKSFRDTSVAAPGSQRAHAGVHTTYVRHLTSPLSTRGPAHSPLSTRGPAHTSVSFSLLPGGSRPRLLSRRKPLLFPGLPSRHGPTPSPVLPKRCLAALV